MSSIRGPSEHGSPGREVALVVGAVHSGVVTLFDCNDHQTFDVPLTLFVGREPPRKGSKLTMRVLVEQDLSADEDEAQRDLQDDIAHFLMLSRR